MQHDLAILQQLQSCRVRMRFDDDHKVIARLLSADAEADGSQHLLYDDVEWTNQADTYGAGTGTCYYADAGTLVSIELAGDSLAGTA